MKRQGREIPSEVSIEWEISVGEFGLWNGRMGMWTRGNGPDVRRTVSQVPTFEHIKNKDGRKE